jgi:hypothetical protein
MISASTSSRGGDEHISPVVRRDWLNRFPQRSSVPLKCTEQAKLLQGASQPDSHCLLGCSADGWKPIACQHRVEPVVSLLFVRLTGEKTPESVACHTTQHISFWRQLKESIP